MLGGVKAEGSSATYVPIPGLSEQGNAVLRRALTPGHHYENARAFVEGMPEEVFTTTQPAPRGPVPKPSPSTYREAPSDVMGMAMDRRCYSPAVVGIVLWQGVRFAQRLRIAQAPRIEAVSPTPEPVATSSARGEHADADPSCHPCSDTSLAPTPSPYEQALAVAEELRLKDDLAGAIAAYTDIVTNFPNEEHLGTPWR